MFDGAPHRDIILFHAQNKFIGKTKDEPLSEHGPLEEGSTCTFRAEARNTAGYGRYPDVWVVEVV